MKKLMVSAVLILPLISSCATILSGETQKINVTSEGTPHVKFRIDNKEYETPAVVTVKREGKDKIIVVENNTCTQKQVVLTKKINPLFFGNLLSGGIVGGTIDYLTGAMWQYDNNVRIQCK